MPDLPPWVRLSPASNPNLGALLTFAEEAYGRQIDWFQRHRDHGMWVLASVLTAEFAVVSLQHAGKGAPRGIAIWALIFLSVVSLPLGWSSIKSCYRSYMASLEAAVLVTQVVWAMGLTTKVDLVEGQLDDVNCPLRAATSLYPPRYFDAACGHKSVEDFVKSNFLNHDNTYFYAKVVLVIFCGSAFGFGILAIWSI